jgi:hypothetical protein
MEQHFFSLELDYNTQNLVKGCLTINSLKQFLNEFIVEDKELLFFHKNQEEIKDIIANEEDLYEYIYNLIDGEENVGKYLQEIEKVDEMQLKKINDIFELDILEIYNLPKSQTDSIQHGGSFEEIMALLIVIGGTVMYLMGRKRRISNSVHLAPSHPAPYYGFAAAPPGPVVGPSALPAPVAPVPGPVASSGLLQRANFDASLLFDNPGKCRVVIMNRQGVARKHVIKITVNPMYFQEYLDEAQKYNDLRASSPGSQIAEFYDARRITARYQGGRYLTNITIGSNTFQFNDIRELVHMNSIQRHCHNEFLHNNDIILTYISGNYYPNILSLWDFVPKAHGRIPQLTNAIELTLTNIHNVYTDAGFVHCDMKIDNVLIDTTHNFRRAARSLIFDLDFSMIMGRTSNVVLDDTHNVNAYLQIRVNGTNRLCKAFLHFFDIYMCSLSMQSLVNHGEFRQIVNNIATKLSGLPHRPNSYKYFILIYWLTRHYEINTRGYSHQRLVFATIVQNFTDFRISDDFDHCGPLVQEYYREFRVILNEQISHVA